MEGKEGWGWEKGGGGATIGRAGCARLPLVAPDAVALAVGLEVDVGLDGLDGLVDVGLDGSPGGGVVEEGSVVAGGVPVGEVEVGDG